MDVLRKNSIQWEKHFTCICKIWSVRGWDLRPLTDQAAQANQSTIHRPLLVRRYEDILSHFTKGFQEPTDTHRQKQEVPSRTLLTVWEKGWSRGKDTSLPASGHGADRRRGECTIQKAEKQDPKLYQNRILLVFLLGFFRSENWCVRLSISYLIPKLRPFTQLFILRISWHMKFW